MRRRTNAAILVLGVTWLLAAGGTLTAWASWTTGATTAAVGAAGARIPTMAPPRAELSGDSPTITWTAPVTATPIDRFVVTRTAGSATEVVCTVPISRTTCSDKSASPGSVRYVVHATLGPLWAGIKSDPSDTVTISPAEPATLAARTEPEPPEPAEAPPATKATEPTATPTPEAGDSPTATTPPTKTPAVEPSIPE